MNIYQRHFVFRFFIIMLTFLLSPLFFWIFWFSSKRRSKISPLSKEMRVLVIPQLTRIGDIVSSTPVFRAIKINYPSAFLSVLVSRKAAGILRHNKRIDSLIIFEDFSFWGLIKFIRRAKFDVGFSLSGTSLSSILFFWAFVPVRVKTLRSPRPLTEIFTDWLATSLYFFKEGDYLPRHHLKLLSEIGISKAEVVSEVFTPDYADKKVGSFLENSHVDLKRPLVGISITAGNRIKEWGDSKFAEVADYIVKEKNGTVIFLGSPSDKGRIDSLLVNRDKLNFLKATEFTLEELPALIKRLSLYIAVDTGPIYIAQALKIPLIDIIGPVEPHEQPPSDSISIQVSPIGVPPCSFVFREAMDKESAKRAVLSISKEQVIFAINKLL